MNSFLNSLKKTASDVVNKVGESFKVIPISYKEYFGKTKLLSIDNDLIALYLSQNTTIGVDYSYYEIIIQDKMNIHSELWFRICRVGTDAEARKYFDIFAKRLSKFATSSRQIYNVTTLQTICDCLKTNETWTAARVAVDINFSEVFKTPGSQLSHFSEIDQISQEDGITALHASIINNNLKMFEILMNNGANINQINPYSLDTSYHYVVATTNVELVSLVCRHAGSKNINNVNNNAQSVLGNAIYCKNMEIVRLLLQNGAKWFNDKVVRPPAFIAVKLNYQPIIDLMLETKVDIDVVESKYCSSLLHWSKSKSLARLLIDEGKIDPNLQSITGDTALHVAIKKNRSEVYYFLILADVDLNIQNNKGLTALQLAILADDVKLVRGLLLFGADSSIINNQGEHASTLAIANKSKNKDEILQAMNQVGAINLKPYLDNYPDSKMITSNSQIDSLVNSTIQEMGDGHVDKSLRVLSLDGGGIRGIVLTKILQTIEAKAGKPIHELFDWIVGTSTGALLAAAIAKGRSPAYCQRLYFRLKDEVFKGSRPYSSEKLENFLIKEFGKNTKMTSINKVKLVITVALGDRHPTELFLMRSYDPLAPEPQDLVKTTFSNKSFEPLPKPEFTNIWEACRYSASAPSYFRPKGRFIDGGMVANNPTMDILCEIERYNRKLKSHNRQDEVKNIKCVCSVGTGRLPTTEIDNVDIKLPTGLFSLYEAYGASKNMLNILVDAATETDRYIVARTGAWCRMINAEYFRFNSQLKENMPMDTVDDEILMQVLWDTEVYLFKNKDKIEKLVKTLLE